ncbi:MAG: hypothetical protein QOG51_1932 [Verrucomicrobiota bacterium]
MSGMFFDNPAVRFSRRDSLYQTRMRSFASQLFRWVTGANRPSVRIDSRRHEAEFPAATQIVYQLLLGGLFGSRALDRASNDALRPHNNWVKPEDQYGISIIGEKWPATTRRLPQKGRLSLAPPRRAHARTGEEIVLGENHGVFWRRETGAETSAAAAGAQQRFGTFAHVA